MRQGAVGQVRLVDRAGRTHVEKRFVDPVRCAIEAAALRALTHAHLPTPEVIEVGSDSIVMTLLPGDRLDDADPAARLAGARAAAPLLRRLHALPPPPGLPPGPDDAAIVSRYRAAGGPPLPLTIPPRGPAVFCHGDWTDGNLLAVDGVITGVVDWEAAHAGDALRDVSRAAWGASLKDPAAFDAIVDAYGADRANARTWTPIHAAELWLWFREAGPPEYLESLTARLLSWPQR